jgi:hypothetical protein
MIIVLTMDQRASRVQPDLVPAALATLNVRTRAHGLLRRFERTAGDEVQGVLSTAEAAVDTVARLMRANRWNIGMGIGEVERPLPSSTRAGRGDAYLYARDAVNRAKSNQHHLSVVGADPYRADQVETGLWLWAMLLRRRSDRGWEVAELLNSGLSQTEAARHLGISQPAVAQRAQAAGVVEEQRARLLVTQLLAEAASARARDGSE